MGTTIPLSRCSVTSPRTYGPRPDGHCVTPSSTTPGDMGWRRAQSNLYVLSSRRKNTCESAENGYEGTGLEQRMISGPRARTIGWVGYFVRITRYVAPFDRGRKTWNFSTTNIRFAGDYCKDRWIFWPLFWPLTNGWTERRRKDNNLLNLGLFMSFSRLFSSE